MGTGINSPKPAKPPNPGGGGGGGGGGGHGHGGGGNGGAPPIGPVVNDPVQGLFTTLRG
jgi:hypothetical protein